MLLSLPTAWRHHLVAVVVFALLASVLAVLGQNSSASAVGTATVSGNVKGTGVGNLAGVQVVLLGTYEYDTGYGLAETDASGNFTISGVGPGTYTLFYDTEGSSNFARQWFSNATSFASATFFTVGSGAAVTGKNAVLGVGASISGNVKGAANANLSGVDILVLTAASTEYSWDIVGNATTDGSGNFSIQALPSQSLTVYYSIDANYVPVFYGGALVRELATYFTPAAGSTTTGRNAVLAVGATVSGNVQGDGDGNLGNVYVSFENAAGEYLGGARTEDDGNYTATKLPAGALYARFDSNDNWVPEWWNNARYKSAATPLTLTAGSTQTGVNAVLEVGATISGVITDELGEPFLGSVILYETGAHGDTQVQIDYTNSGRGDLAPGEYLIDRLPVGTYKLGFTTYASNGSPSVGLKPSTGGYVSQFYSDKYSYATATAVAVTSIGQEIDGINVQMRKPIFGDVADPSSAFYTYIEWMYSSNISTGTPQSGTKPLYSPGNAVSRQAMASFLYTLSGETFTPPGTASFADVAVGSTFFTAIEWMKSKGISTGTPQSSGLPLFKPADAVSRSAMASFLSRYDGATLGTPTTQSFADVPLSATTAAAIEWMKTSGISTGTAQPSGLPLYKPSDPVSRQAMAAFLYRLAHLE